MLSMKSAKWWMAILLLVSAVGYASEEEAVELKGDLVWRVQIRKGYHPQSLRGVTTLIDVQFNSQDISNESEPT